MLLYLSEDFQKEDGAELGAELVLQPFLQSPVTLSPLFNRGVLFLSDRILHYTLPGRPSQRRWLLTIWLEGDAVDSAFQSPWPPLLQRLLAPAIYKESRLVFDAVRLLKYVLKTEISLTFFN